MFSTRNRRLTVCLFLVCSAWAQQRQRLTIELPSPVTIRRGGSITQATTVTVQPGSHVNGDKPRGAYLIPLQLEWAPGPVTAVSVHYPPSEELKVGEENLLVLTGSFAIKTEFKAARSAQPGPVSLKGKLHYQACNTQMCFRPATAEVILPVTLE